MQERVIIEVVALETRPLSELDTEGLRAWLRERGYGISEPLPPPDAVDQAYRNKAREQYGREGEIEIDEGCAVSRGDDAGAYVGAWLWVADEDEDAS